MDNFEEKKLLSSNTEDSTEFSLEEPKVEVSEELSDEALESIAGGYFIYEMTTNGKGGGSMNYIWG